jgi:hypothetical protein
MFAVWVIFGSFDELVAVNVSAEGHGGRLALV